MRHRPDGTETLEAKYSIRARRSAAYLLSGPDVRPLLVIGSTDCPVSTHLEIASRSGKNYTSSRRIFAGFVRLAQDRADDNYYSGAGGAYFAQGTDTQADDDAANQPRTAGTFAQPPAGLDLENTSTWLITSAKSRYILCLATAEGDDPKTNIEVAEWCRPCTSGEFCIERIDAGALGCDTIPVTQTVFSGPEIAA